MSTQSTQAEVPTPTALHELARQFDLQGFKLKRSSHCGAGLFAACDGDVRHLDSIADAKRFLQNIAEGDHA